MNHKTLCIIEDDSSIISLLKETLHVEGYRVIEFSNAQEAFSGLRSFEAPTLVLVDFISSKTSSSDLHEIVKMKHILVALPIVASVGETSEKIVRRLIDLKFLLQVIREHCGS